MKIKVEDLYDGFNIVVDGKSFNFDQEDDGTKLVKVLKLINPEAEVTYEDVY